MLFRPCVGKPKCNCVLLFISRAKVYCSKVPRPESVSLLPNLTGIYLARCTIFLADLVVVFANHVLYIPVHLCLTE